MIKLHKKESDTHSEKLEEKLKDLVISFKKEVHSSETEGLPYIEEDGRLYKTEKEIEEWLEQIKKELSWQRSLSGDGCYIDPETDEIC